MHISVPDVEALTFYVPLTKPHRSEQEPDLLCQSFETVCVLNSEQISVSMNKYLTFEYPSAYQMQSIVTRTATKNTFIHSSRLTTS